MENPGGVYLCVCEDEGHGKLGYKKQLAVDHFHLCHGISSELKTVGKTRTSWYTFSEYF